MQSATMPSTTTKAAAPILTPAALDRLLARAQEVLRDDKRDTLADAIATARNRYTIGKTGEGRRRCQIPEHRRQLRAFQERAEFWRLKAKDLDAQLREAVNRTSTGRLIFFFGGFLCAVLVSLATRLPAVQP